MIFFQRYILTLLFVAIIFLLHAQDYRFKHIGKEQGLSQSRVNSIIQDKEGFLWFATDDGLNKYNGQNITVYKNDINNPLSISDNWINDLYLHDDGTLYIGTLEGGLNVYNKYHDTFKRHVTKDNEENSLSSNHVTTIIKKDEKSLWIGTDNGLNIFDITTGKFTRINEANSKLPSNNIKCLYQDKNNILWIGTAKHGLVSFDNNTKLFTLHTPKLDDGTYPVHGSNKIRNIFEDRKGRLWICTDGSGAAIYDRQNKTFRYFFGKEIVGPKVSGERANHIIQDKFGTIWIATNNGISIYDENSESFNYIFAQNKKKYSLRDDNIQCLFEDNANSIWIGTGSAGVSVYHKSSGAFNTVNSETPGFETIGSDVIFAFSEDLNGEIWIGTYEAGLLKFNPKNKTIVSYPLEKNKLHNNILSLEYTNGKTWIGSWGKGLGYYDHYKNEFSGPVKDFEKKGLLNKNITDIETDENGNLWLATIGGLHYYDIEKDTFISYTVKDGLSHNFIYSLYYDKNGILWIGTNGGGLNKLDTKTKQIKIYTKAQNNAIAGNTIYCIKEDKEGNLWIATRSGLSKLNPKNESFTNYYEKDGLSNSFILGILFDKRENLWLSTNNGLTRFNPNNNDNFATRRYYAIDGLQADEFNQGAFFQTKSGEMYFGGIKGFNHFYPENILDNPNIPPVVITSFKVFGKEYPLDSSVTFSSQIKLSYKNNFFSFEFAALDFVLPEKNLFSYKMEGLDDEWSIPSNRAFASYTGLEGGDYVFHVRACNNDGVWNNNGTKIKIHITPPFYKTNLFYSLTIFLGLALVFIFIRIRVASIKKEKRILEEKVAQRTKELAEKNNDIMSSIEYAKRIQEAMLPELNFVYKHLPDAFVLYKPKDIVSGDFYWFGIVDDKKIIAAIDCTGHGVPGAFMSMIGHNMLNQIILEKKITEPAQILQQLNESVKSALKQQGKEKETQDGMDVALCVIDEKSDTLFFAGAFRPLILIKGQSLEKIEGDKFPIGGALFNIQRTYTTHQRKLTKGNTFYIFSDGFADQFGGPKAKKFMLKQLQSILINMQNLSMIEQHYRLLEIFENWAGNLEQVDDVLIIGIRY